MSYTNEDLDSAVKEIYAAVAKAETISEELREGFTLEIAYGMGGWYVPKSSRLDYETILAKIEENSFSDDDLELVKELLEEYAEMKEKNPTRNYVFDLEEGVLYRKSLYEDDSTGWRSSSSSC